jgi:hypothetical protein
MTLKLLAAALVLTKSTSAMARNNRAHGHILPGYGYLLSDKDFAIWDYAAYRYHHPNCRFCRCTAR